SASPDVVRYNLYHSFVSGGPYTQMSIDPIDHAVFLDTGLPASTVLYYVVTAIDDAGNESAYSAQGSASTNPPQMPGFPIQLKTQTTSSPAVGDIDGDGDLEIVVGNEWIYAWHHDGLELKDGDGDPQSWGVLTTAGSQFTAPVALGNIDNNPGLDILAADLTTKKVYCVDYQGNALPGWPQQAENDFRAAPAVGDLDGDGLFEVIAVDSKGIVYAWNRNGTEWIDGDANPATPGVFFRTAPAVTYLFQTPTICDLDGDHKDEIIVGTASDSVWAFNGNKSRVPGFPVKLNNDLAGSICAGDIDGDGFFELLAQTKGLIGKAYVINHDGTIAAGWPVNAKIADIFFTPSPALGDFNNDGDLECVVYAWDGTAAKINIFNPTGTNYPGWPKTTGTKFTDTSSLTVADVNGDGSLDVILGDESRYIYAYSSTGALIPGFPVQAEDAVRSTPFLTDVDLDGDIDMIVHSWDQNVYAFDLSGAYNRERAPWPTYQANSHRNGTYGFVVTTAIGDPEPPRIDLARAQLFQNHPNPFNPTTRIEFVVPGGSSQRVTLTVYDVTGARVKTLIDGTRIPGAHVTEWDGRDARGRLVGSGVYFYRLQTEDAALTRKMVLLK
ncbi:FG-GAP-like repeat-containing protein, partial [Candidatus Uhrbacteria bacterium]|nr:FG-GAP-like repeat-containing protein [Candidatus Uhrbacteria bacterium]